MVKNIWKKAWDKGQAPIEAEVECKGLDGGGGAVNSKKKNRIVRIRPSQYQDTVGDPESRNARIWARN